ncbi:hypothetical protein E2562_006790 [Oryza meyeriana var. granulata]|uniref:BAG domain-containing protein n=1 Tax=Oryza meyeriana var. granulata TaxID=110450 RepID=A0A6G1C6A5_9ORYZ|nr:hypothetical protein E2562_006790 [Oryza meyeriana var. granulata]
MASSRRFFGYDPYDYYYTSPYDYAYPYYSHSYYPAAAPAPARRRAAGFFPADEGYGEPVERVDVLRPRRSRAKSVSVPVQFAGSEPEMETRRGEMRVPVKMGRMEEAVPVTKKREMEAEEAAVRLQAAARGFLARRMVREVRAVEAEAEAVARKVEAEAEALMGDARGRIAVGEALMRLLLRLDAVHGAREYRRRVTKRVLALQDAVDALEHRPAPVEEEAPEVADDAPASVEMEEAHDAQENNVAPARESSELTDAAAAAVDMEEAHRAEKNEMAPESMHAAEHSVEAESKSEVEVAAPETGAEMEVDGGSAIGGEAVSENAAAEQVVDGDMSEQDEEAEGEWEMVMAESDSAAACHTKAAVEAVENSAAPEARHQEPAGEAKEKKQVVSEGVDTKKVMEMVAALCERSAQQCAVIGALAERVDVLERAVRRVEKADQRRRRNKKLKKEGKANNKCIRSCYSD